MGNEGKALVSGGSGFIGRHLVSKLRRAGWPVRCLVRKPGFQPGTPAEDFETVIGDLSDRDSLTKALSGVTTVFHLAGKIRGRSREEFFQTNCQGTENLLEAARASGRVERFVSVSSLSAAGPSPDGHPLREEEAPNPVSFYGESKLAAEKIAKSFRGEFPVTILRPAAVYGPGDPEILRIIKLAARGWRFRPGGAGGAFSSLHVSDAADGIILAAENISDRGSTYFLADGNVYNWEETFTLLERILGKRTLAVTIPWTIGRTGLMLAGRLLPGSPAAFYLDKIREMSHKYWVCDIRRAREGLGFQPRNDLESGLQATIEWYRAAGWL